MAQSLTFSNIDIIDDGTDFIIKAGSEEILSINKTTGIINTQVNVGSAGINTNGDLVGGGISIVNSEISSGVHTFFVLNPATGELTINGQPSFTNPIAVPQINISNVIGSETCGSGTVTGGSVVISTTAVQTSSIILLTAADSSAANLYINSINDGVSFEVRGTDGNFNWLIINPV